jgi:hypothetical protein
VIDKPALATHALAAFEQALTREAPETRSQLLPELARLALSGDDLSKANDIAEQAVGQAANDPISRNTKHHGHLVLGRIALRKGDLETAKSQLLLAGETPVSIVLSPSGPGMQLAKLLLDRGERDVVLSYLELCIKSWGFPNFQLADWFVTVSKGRMPHFGPSLDY